MLGRSHAALESATTLAEAWTRFCEVARDATTAHRIAIHDVDAGTDHLDVICHAGAPPGPAPGRGDPRDPVALAVDERLPIVRGPDGDELSAGTLGTPVRAAFPIVIAGRTRQVLAVDFAVHGATADELALLGDLAETAAEGMRRLRARWTRDAGAPAEIPQDAVPTGGSDDGVIATAVLSVPDLVAWQCNVALAELVGMPVDDLIGEDAREWVDVVDQPRLAEAIDRAGRGPTVIHTVALVTHDGRRRWSHLHLSPLAREAEGAMTAIRLQVVGVEVDGRHGSRAQLRLQSEVLERTARQEPLPQILAELCRAVEDPRAGTRCTVLLHEDGFLFHAAAPGMPDALIKAVDGLAVGPTAGACGAAAHLGTPVVVSDTRVDPLFDDWRPLAMQLGFRACWSTPVVDEHGDVLATLATYSRRARQPTDEERMLHGTAVHLAAIAIGQHNSRERVERLTGQLEAANAGLVRANQAKDEFLSMTSHELRTPLTPMTGVIETLQQRWEQLPAPAMRELLGALERHTVRMRQLVDDLLMMSRASAGGLGQQRETVDVRGAIDEAVASLFISHRDIRIECPADVAVDADPAQVHQVLVNYLSNSVKYAPEGTITVRCTPGDRFVRLAVEDDGPGVPADLLPSLFDPFTQADRGDRRTARGTGLGLAVVRAIASAHGGRAWYAPRMPGPGASFQVELPRASAAA